MKLARLFFRPRWQSKDAAVRAGAVSDSDDAELIAALPDIARTDDNARVRWTALRRLDRLDHYSRAVSDDPDLSLREDAAQVIRERIAGRAGSTLPLSERLLWLERSQDAVLIEHVLSHAKEPSLRAAALKRTTRTGRLAECAMNDPDPDLRLQALERIEAPGTLERIARDARRKDKRVARRAREMLDALDGAGDAARELQAAEQCCQKLDAELAQPDAERTRKVIAEVEARWTTLPETAREPLQKRYQGILRVLQEVLNPTPVPSAEQREALRAEELAQRLVQLLSELSAEPAAEALPDLAARLQGLGESAAALDSEALPEELREQLSKLRQEADEQLLSLREALPLAAPLAKLLSRAESMATLADDKLRSERARQLSDDWTSEFKRLSTRNLRTEQAQQRVQELLSGIEARISSREKAREKALESLPEALERLQRCASEGDLASSRKAMLRVQQLRQRAGTLPEAMASQLASIDATVRELQGWEHWSNNAIRERLIEQAQELIGSGLHPDAVATRVRELQTEWQRLDKLEHDPANPKRTPAAAMARQFREHCHKALEPAQGFFDKRSELRAARHAELEALCASAESDSEETPDIDAVQALRRQLGASLRELADIEPRKRKAMAERLRAAMSRLDGILDTHFEAIEAQRKALVERAVQAVGSEDRKAAAEQLKTLQREWQALPRGRRRSDQALWSEFRAHCDTVFGELKAERTQEAEAAREQRERARELADTLLAMPLDEQQHLDSARQAWREQRNELEALSSGDSALQAELRGFDEALSKAARRLARQQRSEAMLAHLTRAQVLASDGEWPTAWVALPEADSAPLQQLQKELEQQPEATQTSRDDARRLCVQIEFLAALESPEEDRQLRMDHQISRLSAHLSGGQASADGPEAECEGLLLDWCRMIRSVPAEYRDALAQRLERATRKILGLD